MTEKHQYRDRVTGWSFEADPPGAAPASGGLSLQQVRHNGHNFAQDIRVVGLWVEQATSGRPPTKTFVKLDSQSFEVSNVSQLEPLPTRQSTYSKVFRKLKETDECLDFNIYFGKEDHSAFGVKVNYTSKVGAIFDPNSEVKSLRIDQIFLFSKYSNSPSHEPSGDLRAARLFPLVKFRLIRNENVDRTKKVSRVLSIRVDYRLHLRLDATHDLKKLEQMEKNRGNRSGLFRDRDSGAFARGWAGSVLEPNMSDIVFEAVEKPLVNEVVAPGLRDGQSSYSEHGRTVVCWDNVHQWGARSGSSQMISAPGAFHAAHLHWRWGKAIPLAKQQFKGPKALAEDGWAPLIDPRLPKQTIMLAVTTNEPSLDPLKQPLEKLSAEDWASTFTKRKPQFIYRGADIVTWVSFQANGMGEGAKDSRKLGYLEPDTEGVFFPHGFFFAHEAEIERFTIGPRGPDHRPRGFRELRSNPQWFRAANK